jgi:predicted O-methyltransferase YrrM
MRRYNYLWEYIEKFNITSIMEIGTYTGDHALTMIATAERLYPTKTVHYYGFDLFEDMTKELFDYEVAKWPSSMSDVAEKLSNTTADVELIKGNSNITLPLFIEKNKNIHIDLIFIDGGHSVETMQSDWNNISKIIDDDTIVLCDDYLVYSDGTAPTWGSRQVIDNLDKLEWDIKILPNSDFLNAGMYTHIVEVRKKHGEIK